MNGANPKFIIMDEVSHAEPHIIEGACSCECAECFDRREPMPCRCAECACNLKAVAQ